MLDIHIYDVYNCTSLNNTIRGGRVMKKKVIIIISIILVLIIAIIVGATIFMSAGSIADAEKNVAYVTQISKINGLDIAFSSNRYSGVVEMQELVSVKADNDKLIKETFVKEGDTVKKGDKLFEYDIEQMKLQLSQSQLDLDQAESEITMCKSQISSLELQKNSADQNELLNIESQILSLQLEIKRSEYTVGNKKTEIDKLNDSISSSVVKSEADGKIQSVGENSVSEELQSNNAYITIATNDDYRVKAMISEENIGMFYEEAPILIRSRLDESKTWTGKVSSIDTTSTGTKNSDMSGVEVDTKYPVYIELDNAEGLMVGQHITVELNSDANEQDKSKLWLDEFYICDIDTAPYVWCMNKDNLLEKRKVELGEYDEDNCQYEIVSGLKQEDYIAFPEEHLTEGMTTSLVEKAVDDEITGEADSAEVL